MKTTQEYEEQETQEEQETLKNNEREEKEIEEKAKEQPMGDVYDVYAKAVGVHSKISNMSEDYTLTRYDQDIYNDKFPKFVREQRKVLRIIKSFIIIPLTKLKKLYNSDKKAKETYFQLHKEYKVIEELIIGELDECVIMGRTPKGEVIKAFLQHGLNQEGRVDYESETERPTTKDRMTERTRQ